MLKNSMLFLFLLLSISNSVHANDDEKRSSGHALKVAGGLMIGLGIMGLVAKDSSSSSGIYEAKRAGGLIALAGASLMVWGHKKSTNLSFAIDESAPTLSLVHRF